MLLIEVLQVSRLPFQNFKQLANGQLKIQKAREIQPITNKFAEMRIEIGLTV